MNHLEYVGVGGRTVLTDFKEALCEGVEQGLLSLYRD
jgi:hypothetical protein